MITPEEIERRYREELDNQIQPLKEYEFAIAAKWLPLLIYQREAYPETFTPEEILCVNVFERGIMEGLDKNTSIYYSPTRWQFKRMTKDTEPSWDTIMDEHCDQVAVVALQVLRNVVIIGEIE